MPSWAIFSMPAMARLGSFWSSKVTTSISYVSSPIFTPPVEFHQSARVSIERTFDVPQAAAGPLVTPTKPILRTLFAASAGMTATASESAEASPRRAARNDIARYPIVVYLRAPPPRTRSLKRLMLGCFGPKFLSTWRPAIVDNPSEFVHTHKRRADD